MLPTPLKRRGKLDLVEDCGIGLFLWTWQQRGWVAQRDTACTWPVGLCMRWTRSWGMVATEVYVCLSVAGLPAWMVSVWRAVWAGLPACTYPACWAWCAGHLCGQGPKKWANRTDPASISRGTFDQKSTQILPNKTVKKSTFENHCQWYKNDAKMEPKLMHGPNKKQCRTCIEETKEIMETKHASKL